ncbi:hypothetical protein EK21DRAFT_53006 [Setomelanomma holmii]|uniref:Cell wall mannoprotein PIR1-like C-terminal domain-containing protein n=1 Tax=Setomelanomma holmii TaxID=210430 RepID=A0A9P4HKQ3_9PLEO|nr:hypothetical protein EK21DRAFT_53006 [Setomelanomma holmii]
MKSFALLALAATALAQTPAGCQSSSSGSFNIQTVNVTKSAKRDLESRQLAGALTLTLNGGILKDQAGRQGYIAANYQFQFDAPIQAGARQTSGFSLCSNSSLALGSSAVWYQCLSGSFYNLYSQSTGAQCIPIYITAVNQGGASGGVSQISDGQPQATSPRPVVSQISDGQPQASSPRPVVSQISDGQPQAGTPKPTSAPVVSQISDGQPQAPRPTSRPVVSQISDGQPQAPLATSTRAGNLTTNTTGPSVSQFTGAAATGNVAVAAGGLVAGLFGLFAML